MPLPDEEFVTSRPGIFMQFFCFVNKLLVCKALKKFYQLFLLSYLWLHKTQLCEMWLLMPPVPYEMHVHKLFKLHLNPSSYISKSMMFQSFNI